jgi:hypothetical protein
MPISERQWNIHEPVASAGPEAFDLMQAAFHEAVKKCGDAGIESHYVFAGRAARIRVVGRRLAQHVLSPFSHLRTGHRHSQTFELAVDIWDESETGVTCPMSCPMDALRSYRAVTASTGGRFLSDRGWGVLTVLDRHAQRIIGSCKSVEQFLAVDRGKPFNKLLGVWYRDQSVSVIHAAMVSQNDSGIVFVGKGGSGKSTSALACVCAGFSYLGDDAIGLREQSDGSFLGYSLYNSSLLDPGHLRRFPRLIPFAIASTSSEDPKSLILLSGVLASRVQRAARLTVVVLPRVAATARTLMRPASKGEALLALAPSSLNLQINPGPGGLDQLARLINRVPCYWLELGEEINGIPRCVEGLIRPVTPS